MSHEEKVAYMRDWCARHGLKLQLEGERFLGCECIGVVCPQTGQYPDYLYDFDKIAWVYTRGQEVWTPEDAFRKIVGVAVLGHGKKAERQLYEWLKWFADHGYSVGFEKKKNAPPPGTDNALRPVDTGRLIMVKPDAE